MHSSFLIKVVEISGKSISTSTPSFSFRYNAEDEEVEQVYFPTSDPGEMLFILSPMHSSNLYYHDFQLKYIGSLSWEKIFEKHEKRPVHPVFWVRWIL